MFTIIIMLPGIYYHIVSIFNFLHHINMSSTQLPQCTIPSTSLRIYFSVIAMAGCDSKNGVLWHFKCFKLLVCGHKFTNMCINLNGIWPTRVQFSSKKTFTWLQDGGFFTCYIFNFLMKYGIHESLCSVMQCQTRIWEFQV